MKTAIFVLVFVYLGAFIEAASTKKCNANPLAGHRNCDNLKPKHCYPPVCGKNKDGQVTWFKNSCYLISYNAKCHTNYKSVSDSLCVASTKPKTPEIGKEPCPHVSTQKPDVHHSSKRSTTKRPTTQQDPNGNNKPGGFGGHNEFDW